MSTKAPQNELGRQILAALGIDETKASRLILVSEAGTPERVSVEFSVYDALSGKTITTTQTWEPKETA